MRKQFESYALHRMALVIGDDGILVKPTVLDNGDLHMRLKRQYISQNTFVILSSLNRQVFIKRRIILFDTVL